MFKFSFNGKEQPYDVANFEGTGTGKCYVTVRPTIPVHDYAVLSAKRVLVDLTVQVSNPDQERSLNGKGIVDVRDGWLRWLGELKDIP